MLPTLDDYHWLVSPDAERVLTDAAALLARDGLVSAATKLRKTLSPPRSQLVLQQCELRLRAREKFAHAERMFFTDVGLQQSTGDAVATYKAERFPPGALALDLCCGMGGDLLALGARGPAKGIDREPIAALFAATNARALQLSQVAVKCGDVTSLALDKTALVHIDPDRRPTGQRTTRIELHEPSNEFLAALLQRSAGGAIKLAPACELPGAWQARHALEWISVNGECKQLVAWFGALAQHSGARAATILCTGSPPFTFVGEPCGELSISQVHSYIYEPDAAIIAAGLVREFAEKHGFWAMHPQVAYLTSESLQHSPALAAFAVREVLPFDVKRVKAVLRARRIGRLEVKKRGVEVKPEALRERLKVDGDEQATLIVTPHKDKTIAIIARRVPRDQQ